MSAKADPDPQSIWDAATTDHQQAVDTGRLVVMWVAVTVLALLLFMLLLASSQVIRSPERPFDFMGFGAGVAAILAGLGSLQATLAIYVYADSRAAFNYQGGRRSSSTTTTETETRTPTAPVSKKVQDVHVVGTDSPVPVEIV